eukprot:scaffold12131_cov112-Isochrysis_galbana.AAC.18
MCDAGLYTALRTGLVVAGICRSICALCFVGSFKCIVSPQGVTVFYPWAWAWPRGLKNLEAGDEGNRVAQAPPLALALALARCLTSTRVTITAARGLSRYATLHYMGAYDAM